MPPDVRVQLHVFSATRPSRPTIDDVVSQALVRKEARMRHLLEDAELTPLGMTDSVLEDAEGTDEDIGAVLRYLLAPGFPN